MLIPNPRDIPGTIKELAKYRLNIFPAVNTLFNALANNAEFAKLDFSELVISNGGGMAVQEAVAKKWLAVTGCPIVEGYGLSETSAGVTCNPTDSEAYTGTIGLPMPNVEIEILDDNGNELPLGESGEIAIKGPQVMSGYWQRPDETAKVMTPDGFFKSGDIGVMDERGYVKIVDRKKDMIIVSGFKVFPNEIEDVVASHPGVLECAAVGVPDEKSGEAVMLFVVRRDKALTKEALAADLRQGADRLQAAQVHRVPRRPAEDQRRQDPAPRAAGRRAEEGGLTATSTWRSALPRQAFAEGAPMRSAAVRRRRGRPVRRRLFVQFHHQHPGLARSGARRFPVLRRPASTTASCPAPSPTAAASSASMPPASPAVWRAATPRPSSPPTPATPACPMAWSPRPATSTAAWPARWMPAATGPTRPMCLCRPMSTRSLHMPRRRRPRRRPAFRPLGMSMVSAMMVRGTGSTRSGNIISPQSTRP